MLNIFILRKYGIAYIEHYKYGSRVFFRNQIDQLKPKLKKITCNQFWFFFYGMGFLIKQKKKVLKKQKQMYNGYICHKLSAIHLNDFNTQMIKKFLYIRFIFYVCFQLKLKALLSIIIICLERLPFEMPKLHIFFFFF